MDRPRDDRPRDMDRRDDRDRDRDQGRLYDREPSRDQGPPSRNAERTMERRELDQDADVCTIVNRHVIKDHHHGTPNGRWSDANSIRTPTPNEEVSSTVDVPTKIVHWRMIAAWT